MKPPAQSDPAAYLPSYVAAAAVRYFYSDEFRGLFLAVIFLETMKTTSCQVIKAATGCDGCR